MHLHQLKKCKNMDTKELIQNIVSGNSEAADAAFNRLIQDKAQTVLDIKKVEMTSNIYNTEKPQS